MSSKADKSGRAGGAAAGIKDVEGIARVLGLELLAQRQRRLKQLAALRELTQRADFPPRVKGLWPRAAVIEFARKFVTVSKSKREFTVRAEDGGWRMEDGAKPSRRLESRPRSADELPAQNSPGGQGDLFDAAWLEQKLARFPLAYRTRLRNIYTAYVNGEEKNKDHRRELEEADLVEKISPDAAAGGENISGGQRGVAQWIRNNYPGVVCNHTDIARWMKGEYLPHGCTENFPAYEAAGRYKAAAVRAWVEKYLVKHTNGQELPLDTDYRRLQEKLDYEESLKEAQLKDKARSGLYVHRQEVQSTGTAIGIAFRSLTRDAMERDLPARLGARLEEGRWALAPEQRLAWREVILAECVAVFTDWQYRATGRLDELIEQCQPVAPPVE